MPVFISYSHQDKKFVDILAANLFLAKAHVWIDRWEIQVGDSLVEKVQQAIHDSSALIAVLSKSSVQSNWCSKELNAGLIRELDERRVIVLPALLEDCEIPLFLREKKYADFRTNYDEGFRDILAAVGKVTSSTMGRVETPTWHTDWAQNLFEEHGNFILTLTFAEHGVNTPYTVLTEIRLELNGDATARHQEYESSGSGDWGRYLILEYLRSIEGLKEWRIKLSDSRPHETSFKFGYDNAKCVVSVSVSCRWLGEDTGMNVIYNFGEQVWQSVEQLQKTMVPRSLSNHEKFTDIFLIGEAGG